MWLPSEAEWEYACRSGSDGMYSFVGGEEELGRYGWYGEGWKSGSTHGVGLLKPNVMGLCDMHGNVWEWCGDVWDRKAYGKRESGWVARTWEAEDTGEGVEPWGYGLNRVLRGGSWLDGPMLCRSACRDGCGPGGGDFVGFRLVCRETGPDLATGGSVDNRI